MACFPCCHSPLVSSSSPITEASLQFPTCIGLLVFTRKQGALRMFHIRRPRILQDSFITASSALHFMPSLTHLSWSVLLPKLLHCRRSPRFGNCLSTARPTLKDAICYSPVSLLLIATARLAAPTPAQIKCLLVPAMSSYLVGFSPTPTLLPSLSGRLGLSQLRFPRDGSHQATAHFTSATAFSSM